MTQYQDEVDGVGRRWPRSLKERVVRLVELKVPKRRIAHETGIPKATIYVWFRKEQKKENDPKFVQLPAAGKSPAIRKSPVARLDLDPVKSSQISIKLPNGIEISGLSYPEVLAFCKEVV
jgi:transposase-like protein